MPRHCRQRWLDHCLDSRSIFGPALLSSVARVAFVGKAWIMSHLVAAAAAAALIKVDPRVARPTIT